MSASSEVVTTSVQLPNDLHARPAGQVTKIAATFDARVSLAVDEREVDGRSVLAVMSLGARAGETVVVRAEGAQAAEAAAAVAGVLALAEAVTEIA